MTDSVRGRLFDAASAPATGERIDELVRVGAGGSVRVEQILSGALPAPVDYLQDHDEWVVVLAGRAALEVGDEHVELFAGDWVVLPRDVPHRVLKTSPGTNWLAVHAGS
jgi:cupin 2 domain-containing protein